MELLSSNTDLWHITGVVMPEQEGLITSGESPGTRR